MPSPVRGDIRLLGVRVSIVSPVRGGAPLPGTDVKRTAMTGDWLMLRCHDKE